MFWKKKKEEVKFTPKRPFTWWIDDLTHRHCGIMDDPNFGFDTLKWPDTDKVYIAIDKKFHDEKVAELETEIAVLEKLKEAAEKTEAAALAAEKSYRDMYYAMKEELSNSRT